MEAPCIFEYPHKWQQIIPWLLSDDPHERREAVLLLERRDVALEDFINRRPCCTGGGSG